MSEISIGFTIQGDNEGYVTFECPYCVSEFKLHAGEFQSDDAPLVELYCPYCGLPKSKSSFYSKEVVEKMEALAMNYITEQLNKSFSKMQRSVNKNKNVIKMTYRPLKQVAVKELVEKDTMETEFQCKLCDRHLKVLYSAGAAKIFCPYCGVDL